ncbi:hypothetical protein Tco_0927679 [Tanacetum coccineum]
MNSTKASFSNPSKKIKLTIIPPRQLFVNISSDEDVTTTPSPSSSSSSSHSSSMSCSTHHSNLSRKPRMSKACFETYVKSKDIDLWQVIQKGDFYYEVEDSEAKLMKETPYELLEDDQKKKLGKNNKAMMTLYNALPRKEYERVFMCKTAKEVWHTLIITHQGNSQVKNCKINLLTQEYENFSIYNEETIDSGFTRFNAIVTSLKSLDPDYSSKNHVRKFLRALSEWIRKAKVTREQTSDDSDSQDESDEEVDEEEAEAYNLLARDFHKGNRFGRGNRFEGHFASEYRKSKENMAFVGSAWSDSEDADEQLNDTTCLMAIDSQEVVSKPSSSNTDLNFIDLQKENEELLKFNKDFTISFEKLLKEKRAHENENSKLSSKINDLEIEVKKLATNKEVVEPCKNCDVLTKEVDSLKCMFPIFKIKH